MIIFIVFQSSHSTGLTEWYQRLYLNVKEETKVVHGKGIPEDKVTRSLSIPIYQTAVFTFESAEQGAALFSGEEGYIYTRLGNPTIRAFEEKMAYLENGEDGAAFASGMAAISATILTLLRKDDELIASFPIYGCTFSLLTHLIPKWGMRVKWVKAKDFVSEAEKVITPRTKLLLIESPTNPNIDLVDIKGAAELAHKSGIPLAIDNTFATFYCQKPLDLGTDIVIYSATKFICGHGDTVGGIVIGEKPFIKEVKDYVVRDIGGIISPFNAWLLLRGIKTMAVRMKQHCENAQKVAEFLENHLKVREVFYLGLKSHPQYELAKSQMESFGGMLAFELKEGREAGRRMMDNLKLCVVAVSLGDTATLIEHPASMTHSTYSKEDLEKFGISEGLVRMSVGIEGSQDLIDDLSQALDKV